MATHGMREYRSDMASIHERVANTGEEAVITRGGRPYVKVVPATEQSVLERLHEQGLLTLPSRARRAVESVDAGGDDTTDVVAELRR